MPKPLPFVPKPSTRPLPPLPLKPGLTISVKVTRGDKS